MEGPKSQVRWFSDALRLLLWENVRVLTSLLQGSLDEDDVVLLGREGSTSLHLPLPPHYA